MYTQLLVEAERFQHHNVCGVLFISISLKFLFLPFSILLIVWDMFSYQLFVRYYLQQILGGGSARHMFFMNLKLGVNPKISIKAVKMYTQL